MTAADPLPTGIADKARVLSPGVLLVATIATTAAFLSEHYGGPAMLFALLLGIAFHFLAADPKCAPGIEFASTTLLRVGIALLGARITVEQLTSLGIGPILLVVSSMAATIAVGVIAARIAGRDAVFGVLTGSAVAICGASAALAISAVLPRTDDHERNTLFTVIAVTSLSTVAMILYPMLFSGLGFDDAETGMLIGATIHDVAQVVGAGYGVSEEAGNVATYVKLLRVALLPVVVIAVALWARSGGASGGARWPLFTLAFVAVLLVNSFGFIPAQVQSVMVDASRWLLIAAIAALGVKTSLQAMFAAGAGHLAVLASETVFLAALAVTFLTFH